MAGNSVRTPHSVQRTNLSYENDLTVPEGVLTQVSELRFNSGLVSERFTFRRSDDEKICLMRLLII